MPLLCTSRVWTISYAAHGKPNATPTTQPSKTNMVHGELISLQTSKPQLLTSPAGKASVIPSIAVAASSSSSSSPNSAPCSGYEMLFCTADPGRGTLLDWSSNRGAARKGLVCFWRGGGGPMLAGSFSWGGLAPPGACLGGGGGGMERSCSFTSDFSACTTSNSPLAADNNLCTVCSLIKHEVQL